MPKILKPQDLPKPQVDTTSIVTAAVTDRHLALASSLAARHGKIRVVRERSGIHGYCACPECLESDGRSELYKMHLAINLDKFLAGESFNSGVTGGSAGDSRAVERANSCALCMKTGRPFRMTELLEWPTLDSRNIRDVERVVQQRDVADLLEDDGFGNMVPKHPGKTVLLNTLPLDHPSLEYLRGRGYCIETLMTMFKAEWCYEARTDVKYARLKGDWLASPQNRIILYIYQGGIRRGWQARALEKMDAEYKYCFHYARARYEPVQQRCVNSWSEILEPLDKKWDVRKYLFPQGTLRNELLMGYDAAVDFFEQGHASAQDKRYIVITEGPLSCGKLGSPGVASMGKYFSARQAELASKFDVAFYVHDNDVAGATGVDRFKREMEKYVGTRSVVVDLPAEFKDLGNCSTEQAQQIIQDELKLL